VFIADDALLFPFKSVLWILREVYNAVLQETRNEAESIRTELSQLYRLLERGDIAEADFDLREKDNRDGEGQDDMTRSG
jgi:hypothetical protein